MELFIDLGSNVRLSAHLSDSITSVDSLIPLDDCTNFPSKGEITINSENIYYRSKTSNTLNECIRGYRNTSSVSHLSGSVVLTSVRQTSNGTTDKGLAGWYKDRISNSRTLRVSDSDLLMPGSIRFNSISTTFQGFNGLTWVDFNALRGEKGDDGADAIDYYNVVNLPGDEDNQGEIYSGKVDNNLNLRTLVPGKININPGMLNVDTISLQKSSNYVSITANPLPYVWDFSTNNTIYYLKSSLGDAKYKAFGKISKWKVKTTTNVTAGTAVRVTLSVSGTGYNVNTTELVIEPYTYNASQQETKQGSGMLGIALQTVSGGGTCEVCEEGITSVLMGNGNGAGNQTGTNIDGPGAYGFIGYDGKVYNETISTGINNNTPVIGYWLEKGTFNVNTLVLFNVKCYFSC